MPDYSGLSDREVLILIAERTEDLHHIVNGNGQPGLVTRVARNESALQHLKDETLADIREIKADIPGWKERWGMIGTVVLAAVSLAANAIGLPIAF